MSGADNVLAAADQLCQACVDLLEVDGASISLVRAGATQGTFGASSPLGRRLDEYQFTFGEGPCLDAVREGVPVMAPDLRDPGEQRWPAFREAVVADGVGAVFALPISVASSYVGALDVFRSNPGRLSDQTLEDSRTAAQVAAAPLIALMGLDFDGEDEGGSGVGAGWDQLASLDRVEVYQATGMIMGALNVTSAEALVRLRAYAFSQGITASEAAWLVVDRRLLPAVDDWWREPSGGGTAGE